MFDCLMSGECREDDKVETQGVIKGGLKSRSYIVDAFGCPERATYAHLVRASQQAYQGSQHTVAWNWQNPGRKKSEWGYIV